MLTAQVLEAGTGLDGRLGDGAGKWRLTVASNVDIQVMSLLRSPTGHLANLSTVPMHAGMTITIPEEPEPEYVCPAESVFSTPGNVFVITEEGYEPQRYRFLGGMEWRWLDGGVTGIISYRRTAADMALLDTFDLTGRYATVPRCKLTLICQTGTRGTIRGNCPEGSISGR